MKNTSHLAGEFLVAGELSRRGYPVSITFGNAKSVDIYAEGQNGVFKIDAKAVRSKTNWPIKEESVNSKVFYIFVFLQFPSRSKKNKTPEYYIARGKEIQNGDLIRTWKGGRQGIKYGTLNGRLPNSKPKYKERWDKLPD